MRPIYYSAIKDILYDINDTLLKREFYNFIFKIKHNDDRNVVIFKSRAIGYSTMSNTLCYDSLIIYIICNYYKQHPYRIFIKDWNRFKRLVAFI